jgi:succinate dehydrogenase / fumarate reductase cytochrome b subunit
MHSLAGLIPIGAFLFFHLGTNSLIAVSSPDEDLFQQQVNLIHSLGPLLVPVEILFIFLPLAFHAGLGIKIWLEGKSNSTAYPYGGNIRYTLQRITGVIALLFILFHLYHMHWTGAYFPGGAQFDPHYASITAPEAIQRYWWAPPVYVIGVLAAVFHLANGMWTFAITWGITVGPRSQKGFGVICAIFGVALGAWGLTAVQGMATYDYEAHRKAIDKDAPMYDEAGAQPEPEL